MHRYIQQLIEDFNSAIEKNSGIDYSWGLPGKKYELFSAEPDEIFPAKEVVGVSFEELPPAERLTLQQMQELLNAMLKALNSYGIRIKLPGQDIPADIAYREVRRLFKDGFHPGWSFDFCDGWCPDCAFAAFCKMKDDIWTPETLEVERKKNKK